MIGFSAILCILAHNFKIVFLIDHSTMWQEFIRLHAIAIKENSPSHLTEFDLLLLILATLDASIGIETLVECSFWYRSCFDFSFNFSIVVKRLPSIGSFVLRRGKRQQRPIVGNTVVEA